MENSSGLRNLQTFAVKYHNLNRVNPISIFYSQIRNSILKQAKTSWLVNRKSRVFC